MLCACLLALMAASVLNRITPANLGCSVVLDSGTRSSDRLKKIRIPSIVATPIGQIDELYPLEEIIVPTQATQALDLTTALRLNMFKRKLYN